MTKDNDARDQAVAQVRAICKMVAALNVDYDRLEELRDSRSEWDGVTPWGAMNPDYAEELADLEADAGDCYSENQARERIIENALSVEVRTSWHTLGDDAKPDEFRIVLCTGGPHVEIVGDIDGNGEAARPRVRYQDWGTSGELIDFDHDAVLQYCQQFYFGG